MKNRYKIGSGKTGRVRGRLYHLVVELAKLMPTFTPRNLSPALEYHHAVSVCYSMMQDGWLVRVNKGSCGRLGQPPIYRLKGGDA
jgi:hypothetical protein